jgi:hypothetical protein
MSARSGGEDTPYAPPLTLTPALLNQVAALFDGKRVLGPARDIQEVRNAISAYEALPRWNPCNQKHLLEAHGLLMAGLMERPGRFRTGGAGIYRGKELVHMVPPASRVPALVAELLGWLEQTDWPPLLSRCVVHYELEPFVSFLLAAIEDALQEAIRTQGASGAAGSEMRSESGSEMPSQRELEVLELLSAHPKLSATAARGKGKPTLDTGEAVRLVREQLQVARDLLHPPCCSPASITSWR